MWEVLRRKLRFRIRRDHNDNNKKKMMLNSCVAVYDSESYSKNFDQGLEWMEPDNACRSFSARFAVPARIFAPTHLLD